MDKQTDQMYIITAPCWKCQTFTNLAVIKTDLGKRNSFCGPESFSKMEIEIAEQNDVLIREHHSFTRQKVYKANTCPRCNAFIGQHYLFTEYFHSALCGDYEYKVIDLVLYYKY